jgi:hypothetical protein
MNEDALREMLRWARQKLRILARLTKEERTRATLQVVIAAMSERGNPRLKGSRDG